MCVSADACLGGWGGFGCRNVLSGGGRAIAAFLMDEASQPWLVFQGLPLRQSFPKVCVAVQTSGGGSGVIKLQRCQPPWPVPIDLCDRKHDIPVL